MEGVGGNGGKHTKGVIQLALVVVVASYYIALSSSLRAEAAAVSPAPAPASATIVTPSDGWRLVTTELRILVSLDAFALGANGAVCLAFNSEPRACFYGNEGGQNWADVFTHTVSVRGAYGVHRLTASLVDTDGVDVVGHRGSVVQFELVAPGPAPEGGGCSVRTPVPRVYDAFAFFNELDMLEVRLNELESAVDYHVLVEARVTHSNKSKPLHFSEAADQERFAAFRDKIIHVVVEDMPGTDSDHDREAFQRNAIVRGLVDAAPYDLVIISDADEIASVEAVRHVVACEEQQLPVQFNTAQYIYNFNWRFKHLWDSPHVASVGMLTGRGGKELTLDGSGAALTATQVRRHLGLQGTTSVDDAGWHFSFFGGGEAIRHKIDSYVHAKDYADDYFRDEERIARMVTAGMFLFMPQEGEYEYSNDMSLLPSYVANAGAAGGGNLARHFQPPPTEEQLAEVRRHNDQVEYQRAMTMARPNVAFSAMFWQGDGDGGDGGAGGAQAVRPLDRGTIIVACGDEGEPGAAVAAFCAEHSVARSTCEGLDKHMHARCDEQLGNAAVSAVGMTGMGSRVAPKQIMVEVEIDRSVSVPVEVDGATHFINLQTTDTPDQVSEVASRACSEHGITDSDCPLLRQLLLEHLAADIDV